MTKAIIFDCFGVLVHGSLGYLYQITPPERHSELADLSRSSDYGYVSFDDYIKQVAELSGQAEADITSVMRAQHVRDEAMIAYVRFVRTEYKTALLSNVGRSVIDKLFSQQELAELFDQVILSSDIGMVKPHPEIFEYAASKLGVQLDACVMIDDLSPNIEGAIAAGMKGVVYTSLGQLQDELKKINHA